MGFKGLTRSRKVFDGKLCSVGNNLQNVRTLTAKDGKYTPHADGELVRCRQWQVLQGRFRFLFNGRLMIGPGPPMWMLIQVYFLLTFVLLVWYEFEWPETPAQWMTQGTAVITYLLTTMYLFLLALTEPGIIPRPPVETQMTNEKWYKNVTKIADGIKLNPVEIIPHRDMKYLGVYCHRCKMRIPLSTGHCMDTNVCIERFDHYCPSLGVCVGSRNYGYFYKFLWSCFAFFVTVICFAVADFALDKPAGDKAWISVVSIFLIILPVIPGLFILKLIQSHSCLIAKWQTLPEKAGDLYFVNEFDSFLPKLYFQLKNFIRVLQPPPPSHPNFRPHSFVIVRAVPASQIKTLRNVQYETLSVGSESDIVSYLDLSSKDTRSKIPSTFTNSIGSKKSELKEPEAILGIAQTVVTLDTDSNNNTNQNSSTNNLFLSNSRRSLEIPVTHQYGSPKTL